MISPAGPDLMEGTETTLSAFYRETWFTCEGARLKAKRLQARGLPDFTDWRFFTLTVEDRSVPPLTVYLRGKAKLRRFTAEWRKLLGRDVLWLWKLELHEDGYPHWHMLLDYQERIHEDFFDMVAAWWGLGRVNVRRVRKESMHYVFKYVCKGGQSVPDWILDHPGVIRCVQASSGFYTGDKPRPVVDSEQKFSKLPLTLRTLLAWDLLRGILVETSTTGKRLVSVVRLNQPFAVMLQQRANFAIRYRRPMSSASAISIGHFQLNEIRYEHRKSTGLGFCQPLNVQRYYGELAACRWPHAAGNGHQQARQSQSVGG